jgi:Sds3-like
MDSAADSLLALANTADALAAEEELGQDDDRSSSLSELEDEEPVNLDSEGAGQTPGIEADSEAETERLDESPDKISHKKVFGATPSKLAQATHVDQRPEIEALTDSDISSPISLDDESDNLSDAPADEEEVGETLYENRLPGKRKREEDEPDEEEQDRARRRRTGSIASEDAKSDRESDPEELRSQQSRDGTAEPDGEVDGAEDEVEGEDDDNEETEQQAVSNEELKKMKAPVRGRTTRRRGKEDPGIEDEQEAEDEVEAGDESGEEDDVEVDDAEAVAKSEEEQAKRMAAMDALSALERHFAALRDRLYDERISAINQELAQLADSVPSHPELLRQLEAVRKYRDDKFEVEQKLLVYKIGTLKNKSVAERSQIHSTFFQTVRDVRERHLERLSEQFYRIQRDRFKTDSATPMYTIPFPDRRSKRITQQTAYNKEVSILSGVAKYVGFPAAPELATTHKKEMEDDMQKMGVSELYSGDGNVLIISQLSTAHIRTKAPRLTSAFSSVLTAQAAEDQFLEKNAWANPQHPMHRLNLSRQNTNGSPSNDTFLTPTNQQRIADTTMVGVGSASTILEHPSAPASSNFNTPHDAINTQNADAANRILTQRINSASPLETRRQNASAWEQNQDESAQQPPQEPASSPLASRMSGLISDGMSAHSVPSPSHEIKPPGITAGSGFGGSRFRLI